MRAPRSGGFALLLSGAALAVVPAGALAQHVVGTVRDSAGHQPVGGAVVWLTDSAGKFLARSIADAEGRFAVLRIAGSAQLHVVRIGFHPAVVPIRLARGDSVVDVTMGSLPITLGTVALSKQRVCPGDKGTNAALQLWEQARAALMASVVARDAGAPELEMKSFTRSINPVTREVSEQEIRTRRIVGDQSYVAGRPPAMFVDYGYMQESHGDRTFYAPDDAVLLDPSFADTHCLRVVPGQDAHTGLVGIGFEPVPDRARDTLVDVQGVLWLSPAKHEIRSLEFRYTALEREAEQSGGEITFEVMPNGAPMITRWMIRSAQLSVLDPPPVPGIKRRLFDRRDRKNVRLVATRESGGVVVRAGWPSGLAWHATLRTVSGQLLAAAAMPTVAGMRVWLQNTDDTTTTDAGGNYALGDVLPGHYTVMASDSGLARVGVVRGRRIVDVTEGDHHLANIVYLPLTEVIAGRCTDQEPPAGTGVLLGRVTDESGAPIQDVNIAATWSPRGPGDDQRPDRETQSDDDGRFTICGAPLGAEVHLHAASSSAGADTEWKQAPLLTLVLQLRPTVQTPH